MNILEHLAAKEKDVSLLHNILHNVRPNPNLEIDLEKHDTLNTQNKPKLKMTLLQHFQHKFQRRDIKPHKCILNIF